MAEEERVSWTAADNEATVTSYFTMLKKELSGEPFIKARENEKLRESLNGRSKGARVQAPEHRCRSS